MRRGDIVRKWFARRLLHPLRGSPLSEGAYGGASLPAIRNKFRSQTEAPTHKADSRGRLSLQKNKLRAGCRVSDRIQVLLYALRGEKSVIGGTCNPSVAPHLNRKFVREVRAEFLWTVARASGRSNRRFVCFFCNFSFKQRKVYKTPRKGKEFRAQRGGCARLRR